MQQICLFDHLLELLPVGEPKRRFHAIQNKVDTGNTKTRKTHAVFFYGLTRRLGKQYTKVESVAKCTHKPTRGYDGAIERVIPRIYNHGDSRIVQSLGCACCRTALRSLHDRLPYTAAELFGRDYSLFNFPFALFTSHFSLFHCGPKSRITSGCQARYSMPQTL